MFFCREDNAIIGNDLTLQNPVADISILPWPVKAGASPPCMIARESNLCRLNDSMLFPSANQMVAAKTQYYIVGMEKEVSAVKITLVGPAVLPTVRSLVAQVC